jgi:alkylated DNA nucleotide flippase Atl1
VRPLLHAVAKALSMANITETLLAVAVAIGDDVVTTIGNAALLVGDGVPRHLLARIPRSPLPDQR